MSTTPDLSTPAAQRAWEKLLAQEQREIDAEIAAAQHAAQVGRAQREQRQRADMIRCVARLKELAPAYSRRVELEERFVLAAAELAAFDRSLLAEEQRAFSLVDATGVDGAEGQRRIIQMREAAGLPVDRNAISIVAGSDPAKRIAVTCLAALIFGSIDDGVTWDHSFNIT